MNREDRKKTKGTSCKLHAAGCRVLWFAIFSAWLVTCILQPAFAGNIEPSAGPDDVGTKMYTLEQIYEKVTNGTTPAVKTAGFKEPAAGPAGTMYTLDAIEAKIAAGTTDATADDVLSGKTFISRAGGSGESMVTGSIATQTLLPASETVAAGYYAATTLSAVDADLATANIKSGITIFGIAGKPEVVDTSSGDAVSGEILSGKKAWVDGAEVTGNVAAGANFEGGDGLKTFTIPDGLYSGSKTATAIDKNLVTDNIRDTVTIFGVLGTYTGSGGSAGLPKTGQTTSYATGDDGDLQIGIARGYTYTDPITSEATNTLTDDVTGLMWIRDHTLVNGTGGDTGGNVDISGTMNWATALDRCNNLSYAGNVDWRLPNAYELFSICLLENTHGAPFIDTVAFLNTVSDIYWSSTTSPTNTDYARIVYFSLGYVGSLVKTSVGCVRAVRGPD